MMNGYGFEWGDMMTSSGTPLNGTGWTAITVMGIGSLLVVGLIAWFLYTQRSSLGLGGPQTHRSQVMTGAPFGVAQPSSSPSEAVEQIARRRYANGEINTAEYKAIMMTLKEQ